ncbi:MAG: MFS transporter, partial [Actinobacteria bacterium]|nr:MFS transporter [Actinomycetota bacterium]
NSRYFGPVIGSMVLMACGLALVTSPSSESVMGSLPREMAGVGSAINDTSREVGGTLGVAIIGSIFATTYGPKIVELLTPLQLPKPAIDAAQDSVGAAFAVSEQIGEPALAATVREGVGTSFLNGFQTACVSVGIVAILGSLLAWRFLPARTAQHSNA